MNVVDNRGMCLTEGRRSELGAWLYFVDAGGDRREGAAHNVVAGLLEIVGDFGGSLWTRCERFFGCQSRPKEWKLLEAVLRLGRLGKLITDFFLHS